MLVLTRKTNQQILIGENVVITILHVKGQSVRVGIEAPRQLRVVRSEIAELDAEAAKTDAAAPQPRGPEPSAPMPAVLPKARRTSVQRVKSMLKARAAFSSPLADRVTAVVESAGEAPAVESFTLHPLGGEEREQPHGYHFQVGRCSALTTHPSGQRP